MSTYDTPYTATEYAAYLDGIAAKITAAADEIRRIEAGEVILPIFAEFGGDATPLTVEDVKTSLKNVVKLSLGL